MVCERPEHMDSLEQAKLVGKNTSKFKKTRISSQVKLAEALKKKKECNAKALTVVEELLESRSDPEKFLCKLKSINQNHYDDVVEERSIIHLCGYPLCENRLENVPKKQYQISTVSNKVFDITERKKFCSNSCFMASQYIREQMLTSPLWLRDQEVIPEFKLLKIG